MSSEWPVQRLDQIAELNPTRKVRKGSEVAFVDMAALPQLSRDISLDGVVNRVAKGAGAHFQNGDTLLARITPCLENGKTAQVRCLEDGLIAEGSTEFIVLAGQDPADNDFIYYLCRDPVFRDYAIGRMEGTSGRQRVSWQSIAAYEYSFPPADERRAAARVLSGLDDRITLLRETNTTLEAIAQALFKSWFVDFDPVHAKMQGRAPEGMDEATAALFPDSFQESELGPVPKEWRVIAVEDFALRVGMGPFGSNIKVETFVEAGIPVISGQHLKQLLVEDNTFNFITQEHAKRLSKSCVQAGDVIFTHAGSIGQVSLLHKDAAFSSYVLSQRQFFLRCNLTLINPEWVALYFRSPAGQYKLLANTSQVGVPSIARPVSYLRSIRTVVPPPNIGQRFACIASQINDRVMANRNQLASLTSLRDTLLPRLISGQIQSPNAKNTVEKAR